MSEVLLEMRNITKTFTGVAANKDVNLELYPGEIHALLGENGAGKSTLMNVLTGIYKPDYGDIYYKGKKIEINNPKQAVKLGIGMVHQHFRLISTLSVAENVMLNSGECPLVLNTDEMNKAISECSKKYNLDLEPEAKVWQLSVGEQQRVEIVKLLYRGAQILILDEPSAVLTPQESVEMFRTLRMMADSGKAVVFISHKMNEVMANADRITVLRGGKSVATMKAGEMSAEELTGLMVGHKLPKIDREKRCGFGDRVLECTNLNANNDRGLPALKDVSFHIHSGEILGIAGVAGNGQKMLAEVVTGLRKLTGGKVLYKGKDISGYDVKTRNRNGISFIPEDRLGMGLVPSMNMMENIILKKFYRPVFSNRGILKKKDIRKITEDYVKEFDIKNAGLDKKVGLMSGGNQQKLLFAREISGEPDLIVVAYPVRGLDVGAANAVHEILLEQKERGAAILMISEDLEEIFELSDRIAVLYEGQLSQDLVTEKVTKEDVGKLMAGVEDKKKPRNYMREVAVS